MQRCRWCSARKTQKDKALKHDSDCPVTAAIAALSTPCPKASPCQKCDSLREQLQSASRQVDQEQEIAVTLQRQVDSLRERVARLAKALADEEEAHAMTIRMHRAPAEPAPQNQEGRR
jgi:septal ring factor EnvC (AmiA/AmiB activator)